MSRNRSPWSSWAGSSPRRCSPSSCCRRSTCGCTNAAWKPRSEGCVMKEIKAIIQPYMLQEVCDALLQIEGLPGLTVSQVLGFGRTRATEALETERLAERSFAKKTKIEI